MREMKLQDLKSKTPAELVSFAEENGVENASTMRKQELMFAILKQLAIQEIDIIGEGVVEVLSDGFADDIDFLDRKLLEDGEHQLLLAHGAGVFDPILFRERDELGRRLGFEVLKFDFPHWGWSCGVT